MNRDPAGTDSDSDATQTFVTRESQPDVAVQGPPEPPTLDTTRFSPEELWAAVRAADCADPDVPLDFASLAAADVDTAKLTQRILNSGAVTRYQLTRICAGRGRELHYGEYVVVDRLGGGGMGEVFLARHRVLGRLSALKVMRSDRPLREDSRRRFQQESLLAARVEHPNLVRVYDAGADGERYYLAMEWIDGDDLAATIRRTGPAPWRDAVNWILQAAQGLEAAHDAGIIHRDIKPHNLLLDREGCVKALDLGLARLSGDVDDESPDAGRFTETGQVMGTIDFMSPEQALDTRCADERSDIYSLGCTLFYLLVGHPPFPGESFVRKVEAHLRDPIPRTRETRPEIPLAVDHLLARMLAKEPCDRPASMRALIGEIELVLQGGGTPQVGRVRRRTLVFVAALFAAAIAVGGLAFGRKSVRPPPAPVAPSPPTEKVVAAPFRELLPQVDVARASLEGAWRRQESRLVSPNLPSARFALGPPPAEEYEFRYTVIQRSGSGSQLIAFPYRDKTVSVGLNVYSGEARLSAFEMLDGKSVFNTPQSVATNLFPLQEEVEIALRVERDRLEVRANGRRLLELRDAYERLTPHPEWNFPPGELGLGAARCVNEYSRIEVRPLDRRVDFPADGNASREIVATESVAGWSVQAGATSSTWKVDPVHKLCGSESVTVQVRPQQPGPLRLHFAAPGAASWSLQGKSRLSFYLRVIKAAPQGWVRSNPVVTLHDGDRATARYRPLNTPLLHTHAWQKVELPLAGELYWQREGEVGRFDALTIEIESAGPQEVTLGIDQLLLE